MDDFPKSGHLSCYYISSSSSSEASSVATKSSNLAGGFLVLDGAELLMGRCLRSHLDLLKPDLSKTVQSKQFKQKLTHDNGKSYRTFSEGDLVYVKILVRPDLNGLQELFKS